MVLATEDYMLHDKKKSWSHAYIILIRIESKLKHAKGEVSPKES